MSFKFLYFGTLAHNVMNMERKELEYHGIKVTEPHQLEREQLPTLRLSQLSHLERTVIELRHNKGIQSRKDKEIILTGAVLAEIDNIVSSYKILSPERSNLLKLMRTAVGISENNPLDDASREKALKAWEKYHTERQAFLNSIKTAQPLKTSTMDVFERLARHPSAIKNVMSHANPDFAKVLNELPLVDKSNLSHVNVIEKHAKLTTNLAHVVTKKAEKETNNSKLGSNFFASFKNAIRNLRSQDEPVVEEKSTLKMGS